VSQSTETVVETKAGRIEGTKRDGLYIFRGIPYAAAPVGHRRWLPPEPVEPWSGVRQAESFGCIAPQNLVESDILEPFHVPESQSEDCLHLNVWTPGLGDVLRPVLLWIHGGGFTGGSGSQPDFEGSTLSGRGNVVVVTINYRLGSLGFLNLNEVTGGKIPATGNEGLLDQVAALEWVRDNITAFGGNPDNVTIFGQSAGGMSIGCLLAMPQAKGLFHKAILQSGAASSVQSLDQSVRVAGYFLDTLGLSPSDVDALRSLTTEQLLAAQSDLAARAMEENLGIGALPMQPVVDGQVLPLPPLAAIRNGSADKIPIMVGSTSEEWKFFVGIDPGWAGLDETGLLRRCQQFIPAEDVPGMVEAYRQARAKRGETITPGELFAVIKGDQLFRMPAIRLAEAQQLQKQPVYSYLFTWRSPLFGGLLGACHTIELGFVWGTYEEKFSGTGQAVDALARNIQDAWLAFAHTGDPSCESLGAWPSYSDRRETMLLGEECVVKESPYDEERRAWDSVPDTVLGSL